MIRKKIIVSQHRSYLHVNLLLLNLASLESLLPFTNALLTAVVPLQFWKEVVEDTEVRELIWDKSGPAQGKQGWCEKPQKAIKSNTPARSLTFIDT